MSAAGVGALERALRASRERGRKLLVPYLTGGLSPEWQIVLEAAAAAGADAVEVGFPFSDPMMDGPVIQEASALALAKGATPMRILEDVAKADSGGVPVAVMTYYNLLVRAGHERAALRMKEAGVAAAIVPDLPVDELGPWKEAADAAELETVLLAAPTTPDRRLRLIAARTSGFLYAVGVMGVTGERTSLAESAIRLARRCKEVSDVPVLVGVGITTPEQAVAVCEVADGVVVGSAIVRRLLDGEGPEGVARLVKEFRQALDS